MLGRTSTASSLSATGALSHFCPLVVFWLRRGKQDGSPEVRSQLARSHAMLCPDSVAKWALLGQTNSPLIPHITECKLFFRFYSLYCFTVTCACEIGHRPHKPLTTKWLGRSPDCGAEGPFLPHGFSLCLPLLAPHPLPSFLPALLPLRGLQGECPFRTSPLQHRGPGWPAGRLSLRSC